MVSPDGVAPSRMVGVSASVSLPLHHKVHKFSSGTTSPRWSQKNGCGSCIKIAISVLTVCVYVCVYGLCTPPVHGCVHGRLRGPYTVAWSSGRTSVLVLSLSCARPAADG